MSQARMLSARPVSEGAIMRVVGVRTVHPVHRYSQGEITEAFARSCRVEGADRQVLDRLHAATGVRTRNLAMPLADFGRFTGFDAMVEEFRRAAVPLCEQALDAALRTAGLRPRDVDMLMITSATGVTTPPIDVSVVRRMGLRPDVRRIPSFGLGCAGGAVGLARLHDYLTANPGQVAVLLAVELGSLAVGRDDTSTSSFVASGLFGDGVSALVACGTERAAGMPGPSVVATHSRLYQDTERLLAWDVAGSGFRVTIDRRLPSFIRDNVGEELTAFLATQGLSLPDITAWVCHPGGPEILRGFEAALGLTDGALEVSWCSLRDVGNLSSASVLHILERTLADRAPAPGTPGLLMAIGPGVCAEFVLLSW
jgi:alkylresorcinol/alkylpyrone synthase